MLSSEMEHKGKSISLTSYLLLLASKSSSISPLTSYIKILSLQPSDFVCPLPSYFLHQDTQPSDIRLQTSFTSKLPWFEKKGLCNQLQRAVVSISSNIAEGAGRPTDADFAHFLDQALGSAYEVETQLLFSKNINYITPELYNDLLSKLTDIEKQLHGLINSLRKP